MSFLLSLSSHFLVADFQKCFHSEVSNHSNSLEDCSGNLKPLRVHLESLHLFRALNLQQVEDCSVPPRRQRVRLFSELQRHNLPVRACLVSLQRLQVRLANRLPLVVSSASNRRLQAPSDSPPPLQEDCSGLPRLRARHHRPLVVCLAHHLSGEQPQAAERREQRVKSGRPREIPSLT